MISSLRGQLQAVRADQLVLEVHGVGYGVAVPKPLISRTRVGQELFLHTVMIVREDSLSLYGFESFDELDLFQVLLGVNGVGPKSALGIISALTPDELAIAVADQDEKPFRKVSGIGPKTARLILLQLQGKVHPVTQDAVAASVAVPIKQEVVAALISLGWNERQSLAAFEAAYSNADDSTRGQLNQLLKLALAHGASAVNG